MTMLFGDRNSHSDELLGSVLSVQLSKADIALVIDALLQAEMTLPLLDPRYREMRSVDHLRARQLALADHLEELLARNRTG